MSLFGKKQKNGENKKKRKKKLKFKRPKDVKLYYIMPRLFSLAIILLIIAGVSSFKIHHTYQKEVMASSMTYNQSLPLWGGDSKGQLRLGHTVLSKDGKTLATEVKYDPDAHKELSSFGNRYRLRLIKLRGVSTDYKIEYGIFSTDGSGVLTVHSPSGFKDQAFLVMIVDNGHLVTSSDLQSQSQMSDSDLNKSITAQLSSGNTSGQDDSSDYQNTQRAKLPPTYIVRLNAKNASKANRNWVDDRELTYDLFIKKNLAKIQSEETKLKRKVENGKSTLKEMNKRLKENPNDQVSADNKTDLENQISNLQEQLITDEHNYKKLRDSSISKNILAPKQKHYSTYEVNSLESVMNQAKSTTD